MSLFGITRGRRGPAGAAGAAGATGETGATGATGAAGADAAQNLASVRYNSSAQSIPDNTATDVNTGQFDEMNIPGVTYSNPTWTLPAGYYLVTVTAAWAMSATGNRQIVLLDGAGSAFAFGLKGLPYAIDKGIASVGGWSFELQTQRIVCVVKSTGTGDTASMKLQCRQNSGGALTCNFAVSVVKLS